MLLVFFFFTALADGALDPVLTVCAMKEAIALLALMTLSHIVEHQGNLAPLIEVSIHGCNKSELSFICDKLIIKLFCIFLIE